MNFEELMHLLRQQTDEKLYLNVGHPDTANTLGVRREDILIAILKLELEGYKVMYIRTKKEIAKVLTLRGVTFGMLYQNRDKIALVTAPEKVKETA